MDLSDKTDHELFGLLNVARFELDRLNKQKHRSRKEGEIRAGCKEEIPLLEAEIRRRGLEIPHWIYPYSLFG